MTLTVFIGTFNRLGSLERTVKSYERFQAHTPHELVIVDNGSDHPHALDLLDALERRPEVRKVYSLPKSCDMDGLTENFQVALRDQRRFAGENYWFAVSEADICFDGCPPNTLQAYMALARRTRQAVGPHLRIADVPICYPLRTRVLTCESRMLYRRSMNWFGTIPYSTWQIDTTFHLFPAEQEFVRLKMDPWRVGPPYDAMHLDWYLDPWHPTEENAIYISHIEGQQVGSWGKNWLIGYWWAFQKGGPEAAFEALRGSPLDGHDDLCVTSFMPSWAYQLGVGIGVDRDLSRRWLRRAVPQRFIDYWAVDRRIFRSEDEMLADWERMVYGGDLSLLGWGEEEAAA